MLIPFSKARIVVPLCPTIFDLKIFSLDIARLVQAGRGPILPLRSQVVITATLPCQWPVRNPQGLILFFWRKYFLRTNLIDEMLTLNIN
jgi:hypothetical protein